MRYKIIYLLFMFSLSQSCIKKSDDNLNIVQQWNEKEIQIPKNISFKTLGRDTICSEMLKHHYKVLIYLDASSCISCRLNLPLWKSYIDSCQHAGVDVSFLFVVQSDKYAELEYKLEMSHFKYPIIYDTKDEWNALNKFPDPEEFRTFLLNEKNNVILIGNPVQNRKIRKLYDAIFSNKKIILEKREKVVAKEDPIIQNTTVQVEQDSINLGKFSFNKIKKATYRLRNTGNYPLIIQSVNTSCGCTAAHYDKNPVAKGGIANVVLEFKPISVGYFHKTAKVVCNARNGFIHLTISGVVEK